MTSNLEIEIRKRNPWQGEYVNPNPSKLYDEKAQWLLKCDAEIIYQFNDRNKYTDYKFELGMRPEPFNGNPLTAKVIILSLNPGYVLRVNNLFAKILQITEPDDIQRAVMEQKDNQLHLKANSFFCKRNVSNSVSYRDAHCMLDDWYWYDILNKFRNEAGLKQESSTDDVIFNNVALIQYVGYLSKSWKSLPKILPSQEFTKTLIHYIAQNKKEVLFVVSRSESLWRKLIGEEIWDKLDKDNRLVHRKKFQNKNKILQTIRTQQFTKYAFEDNGFEKLVNILRS